MYLHETVKLREQAICVRRTKSTTKNKQNYRKILQTLFNVSFRIKILFFKHLNVKNEKNRKN